MTVAQRKRTRFLAPGLLVGLVVGLWAHTAHAQMDALSEHYLNSDLEWFRPTDFSFEGQPLRKDSGYFFRFDKLSWAFTGERTVIGDPDLVVQSEIIYPDISNNEGTAPEPYQINNSIQDAPPVASFAWGDRYEFGKFNKGSGWMVGIIDLQRATTTATYGFQALQLPNRLPVSDATTGTSFDPEGFEVTGAAIPVGTANLTTTRNGFGSVHVNFATPPDFLLGFRDYSVNTSGVGTGPTAGGPGLRVLSIEVSDGLITDITVSDQGDGNIDNLDGDEVNGFFVILDDEDNVIATGVDYGDLHLFNIAFDTFTVRSWTETQGIELMRTHQLSTRHKLVRRQHNQAAIAYGVRYLRLRDNFYWEGRGSILGRTSADTKVQNSIFGPQIRGMWNTQRGRWNVSLDGRCTFGYNVQDLDQVGTLMENAASGAPNTSVSAQPHAVAYGRTENDFSPVVEFRAESSYQVTSSIALRLGYTAMFIDNITRSSQIQTWSLPDLGMQEGGQQDIFINGVNFGFEIVH